jgi:prolyl-tRNA synthetase
VEADTGVMGGKFSHEFMIPAETGENEVVYCETGDYAANVEKATSRLNPIPPSEMSGAVEKFATPGVVTIESLTRPPHNVAAINQIKTLVMIVENKPVLVLLRGDHQLNEAKLAGSTGTANFRPATEQEIVESLGTRPGSLGAVNLGKLPVYADESLRNRDQMTTGANEDGFHYRNVSVGRDLQVRHWADLRTVSAGEPCPNCGKPLKVRRAIEVGHVFKLGTKYSLSLGALFLDEQGKQQPAIMGCYGIGVTRTLQAIIEQCNDKDGIIWPTSVAPCVVCITPLSVVPGGAVMTLAEKIYKELTDLGIDVIIDDRDERPGVKFKDSELVGFPIRIGIGEKSLAKGEVELKQRGAALQPVKIEATVTTVMDLLKANEQ